MHVGKLYYTVNMLPKENTAPCGLHSPQLQCRIPATDVLGKQNIWLSDSNSHWNGMQEWTMWQPLWMRSPFTWQHKTPFTYHGDSWQISVDWLWALENTASVTCDEVLVYVYTTLVQQSKQVTNEHWKCVWCHGPALPVSMHTVSVCSVVDVLTVFWLASTNGWASKGSMFRRFSKWSSFFACKSTNILQCIQMLYTRQPTTTPAIASAIPTFLSSTVTSFRLLRMSYLAKWRCWLHTAYDLGNESCTVHSRQSRVLSTCSSSVASSLCPKALCSFFS